MQTNTPESILARLKNKICLSLGIDSYRLRVYVDRFVGINFTDFGGRKSQYAKINIMNEINKDRLSWKVFFKFLKIISASKVTISITIEQGNRKVTVSEEVKILNIQNVIEEDNEKENKKEDN